MSTAVLNNNFTSVDAGIMGRNDGVDESQKAGKLREARMQAFYEGKNPNEVAERGGSLRERVMMAKKKKKEEEAKKKMIETVTTPMKAATGGILRMMWLNLVSSWGFSLIWINIHALMRMIPGLSHAFCKMGDEWVPKSMKVVVGENVSKGMGLLEVGGLVLLDVATVFVIMLIVSAVMMILDFVNKYGWFFEVVA